MIRPEKSAASVIAIRSLKWCGTTSRMKRKATIAKIARKSSNQPISAAIDDRFCTAPLTRRGSIVPPSPHPMGERPQVAASRSLFQGRVFNVRADELRYGDGSAHRIDVVEHAASLAIVATPGPHEIVLVKQYRHPAGRELWELPAGTAEPNEEPIDGARRELREETGFRAGRIRAIGTVWTTPGFCSEIMHFFLAQELTAGEPALDEDERIEVGSFTLEAAWRLVARGTADAKTVLALFWLQGGADEIGSPLGR
jgi:ADP-ribose pyrophosphatase